MGGPCCQGEIRKVRKCLEWEWLVDPWPTFHLTPLLSPGRGAEAGMGVCISLEQFLDF